MENGSPARTVKSRIARSDVIFGEPAGRVGQVRSVQAPEPAMEARHVGGIGELFVIMELVSASLNESR